MPNQSAQPTPPSATSHASARLAPAKLREMKVLVIVLFSLSGVGLLLWPFALFGSIFLFDRSAALHTWVTAWAIWTYPLVWGLGLACALAILERRPKAKHLIVIVSAVPYFPILLVMFWHA